MKNKILFLSIMFFIWNIQAALASPLIENVSLDPSYLWMGEDTTLSLNCYDINKTISRVYADITGPGVVLPRLYFVLSDGVYVLTVDNIYLDRIGNFDATITCVNSENETSNHMTGFSISELTGQINAISPNPAYIGDIIEIAFGAKKNGVGLSSGVNFNVDFNGERKTLKAIPVYDTTRGWILKLDAPSVPTNYEVDVIASFDRVSVSDSSSLDVKNVVEFEIVSLDKEWIDINDEITMTLKALERGSVINVNENNLDVNIGSVNVDIESITYHDNLFDVKVVAPSIASGEYNIEAALTHDGKTYSDKEDISFVVPISGKIVDGDNKGLSVTIKFFKENALKLSLITDAFGSYVGSIPPGTYDVEIIFPDSKLYLYDAILTNFDDPIKYFYSPDIEVPGLRNAGLYDFGIAFTYSTVDIEMEYKEKYVDDETELTVFKCSNWNTGKRLCGGDWIEIVGDIDIVRNIVEIESTGLSAFTIGALEGLKTDFSFDKAEYNIGETLIIRGIVKDLIGRVVKDSDITVSFDGRVYEKKSDTNGVFSIEVPVPDEEGNYTISLKVEKYPYNDFNGKRSFIVSKSKSVYINFPDTVRVSVGGTSTQQFSLRNTGQSDLENLTMSIVGINEDYYKLDFDRTDLDQSQEKSFYLEFTVPSYTETGISSGKLVVEGIGLYEEKVFGFNLVKPEEVKEENTPTGFSIFKFPEININFVYAVLIGLIGVVVSLILKKNKVTYVRSGKAGSTLNDIKNVLQKNKITKRERDEDYDSLISSEFPKTLESKNNMISSRFPPDELKRARGGEKNGKSN